MKEPATLLIGNSALVAFSHVPGLEISDVSMRVASLSLRRISWIEWNMVENSDDTLRLYREFTLAGNVFCCADIEDFDGTIEQAKEIQRDHVRAVLNFVAALRLHKPGIVIDPRLSTQYLRVSSLNIRTPGPYGPRLLETPPSPRYRIEQTDLAGINILFARLQSVARNPDPGVALALRSFGFAFGYGLSGTQKLAFLFSALEAVFGEYRRQQRVRPKVTLGAAVATVTRESHALGIVAFLDGKNASRGLRNDVAHGSSAGLDCEHPVIARIENAVRDGLRALIGFVSIREAMVQHLEAIEVGLSTAPAKLAFQKILSYAARGTPAALLAISIILEDPPD